MRRLKWFLLVVTSLAATHCAARSDGWAPAGETYPPNPFVLRLTISAKEIEAGQSLTLEYALTNATDRAVAGCADGWNSYHIWGTKSEQGEAAVSLDRPSADRIFRIPPRSTLLWKADVPVAELGDGPATVRGILQSSCSLWSGSVSSDPVTFVIRSKAKAGGR